MSGISSSDWALPEPPNVQTEYTYKLKDMIPVPWLVALALQRDGWYLRSDIIWSKKNPMPESVSDRPTKSHEYVLLFSKQPRYYWDAEAVREPSVEPWNSAVGFGGGERKKSAGDPYLFTQGASTYHEDREKSGRNIRSVWTIATHAYSEAHFATFPPDLVIPCIKAGTSERGACPACGAPWVRVVESSRPDDYEGKGIRWGNDGNGMRMKDKFNTERTTTGWQPGCSCDAGQPVPCVVLDPFSGSGTVGVVACRLGRDSIGVELNPAYVEMSRRRIEGDAPLLNLVDVARASCDTTDRDQSDSPDHSLPRQMSILERA
jgi:hypothetical protein